MNTRRAVAWVGWSLLGAFLSDAFGFVKFTYPHVADDVHFKAPRAVAAIEGEVIRTQDGKMYRVAAANTGITGGMEVYVRRFGNEVDIEESGIPGQFIMAYKRPPMLCGTPWAAGLNLPLIPITVGKTRRVEVMVVKVDEPLAAPPTAREPGRR